MTPNYQRAATGIQKVFLSEIIEMAAIALAAILTIASVASKLYGSSTVTTVSILASAIIAVVLLIIAFILQLVGLMQAGSENESFKSALYLLIFQLAITIIAAIFGTFNIFGASTDQWTNLISGVREVINIIVTIYVVNGCCELLVTKGEEDLAIKGSHLITIIVVLFAIACFSTFIKSFLPESLAIAFAISYAAAELIAYIIFLSMLARTRRALLTNK